MDVPMVLIIIATHGHKVQPQNQGETLLYIGTVAVSCDFIT